MKQRTLITWAAGLCLAAAICIALYPAVSSFVNEKYRSEIRTAYSEELARKDANALQEIREAAQAYNQSLLSGVSAFSKEAIQAASEGYVNQLNPTGNGIMGYVEIPKIAVNLPIYHGTEAETLEEGIGHLLGSSLPVGGESTHSVLTGHSGMASQKLFTDLHQLEEGDVFYLNILDETLAYQVIGIYLTLPESAESLQIAKGKDYCTLVTCTPIGVNTQRLLIRGSRIPYERAQEEAEKQTASQTQSDWEQQYLYGLLLGAGGVAAFAAALGIRWWFRRWLRRCWRGKYAA